MRRSTLPADAVTVAICFFWGFVASELGVPFLPSLLVGGVAGTLLNAFLRRAVP